jgi:hypothetical protein
MAAVIKRGYYEYTHKECKSVISFEISELVSKGYTDYTGDTDYYRVLTCPACFKVIKFNQYGEPF